MPVLFFYLFFICCFWHFCVSVEKKLLGKNINNSFLFSLTVCGYVHLQQILCFWSIINWVKKNEEIKVHIPNRFILHSKLTKKRSMKLIKKRKRKNPYCTNFSIGIWFFLLLYFATLCFLFMINDYKMEIKRKFNHGRLLLSFIIVEGKCGKFC